MDSEEFIMSQYERPAHGGYPGQVKLHPEGQISEFISGLEDLCNVYGIRIRNAIVEERVNPRYPIRYRYDIETKQLLYSKDM